MAGVVVDQYLGGRPGRNADIEAGASRPVSEIVDDVRRSAIGLDRMWRTTPERAWSGITRDVGGRERPLRELPARRWQEVEIHLVDLDIGVTHKDWSEVFVAAWLPLTRDRMAAHLPEGVALPHFDDPRDELAWLYGRLQGADLPALPPWG